MGIPAAMHLDILGKMDAIFGGLLLIFGGLLLSLLLGWVVPHQFDEDLTSCKTSTKVRRSLTFMLRWVSPPVVAFGLIVSLIDLLQKWSSS